MENENLSSAQLSMRSLGLRNNEYELHCDLMDTPAKALPESLIELIESVGKKIGMCGDVWAETVADWIKGKRA